MTQNLIQNGGFEADWSIDKSHRCLIFPVDGKPYEKDVENIFTPSGGWVTWFRHDPGTWDQPEVRDAWATHDSRRVHSGQKGTLLFTFYRKHDAGFLQQVRTMSGEKLRLTAWAHAWSNHGLEGHEGCLDDGRCSCGVGKQVIAIPAEDIPEPSGDAWKDAIGNFFFSLGIDPTGGTNPYASTVIWGKSYAIYNGYCHQLSIEATAQASTVTVFLRSTTLWPFKHNDAYWDDAELEIVEDGYKSTMLVLPQDATSGQLQEIFTLAYPDRRTFGFSHDDAGNLNGTAVLYNIPGDKKQVYLDFYAERYPDVTAEFAYTSDWEEPPDELLLWQCDPRWKDEKIASPDCPKTLCQTGCWISDCAMTQRFFNIKSNATPSTANQALGAAGGFSGCMTLWNPMKSALGLEVVKRSYDNVEAQEWLDIGNVLFAEVEPEAYTHFVLVTRYREGRFWMHDPYKNVVGWIDEHYPGIESWRLVRPFESSPPPVKGSLVSLHVQSLVEGIMIHTPSTLATLRSLEPLAALRSFEPDPDMPSDLREYIMRYRETLGATLGFVERVKPSVIKIFQLEVAEEVKRRSPNTTVVLRYFTGNQDLSGDIRTSMRDYVRSFQDSLETNHKWIKYVEGFNEIVCSNNADSIKRAVESDYWFAEELMALGLPDTHPQLLNVAVGNPLESEVELLLPAVRQAIKYGGTLGYHAYGQAVNKSNLNDAWQHLAGRALEGWDPVFRAHGLYPKYIFGECGAFATCVDGWRASNCLDGDWPLYLAQLTEFSNRIKAWNAAHGNRCLGGTLFTTGGWGWASWEITKAEMTDPNWPT